MHPPIRSVLTRILKSKEKRICPCNNAMPLAKAGSRQRLVPIRTKVPKAVMQTKTGQLHPPSPAKVNSFFTPCATLFEVGE